MVSSAIPRWALGWGLAGLLAACGDAGTCIRSTDCARGDVCVAGRCVPRPPGPADSEQDAADAATNAADAGALGDQDADTG